METRCACETALWRMLNVVFAHPGSRGIPIFSNSYWKPGGWPVGFRYYRELGFLAHGLKRYSQGGSRSGMTRLGSSPIWSYQPQTPIYAHYSHMCLPGTHVGMLRKHVCRRCQEWAPGVGGGKGFLSSAQSLRANRLASNHIRPPAPASALRH